MLKGINLYFTDKLPLKERIKMVSKAGFDGVLISYPDPNEIDQNWLKKCLQDNNLKIIMIHSRYDESVLDKFWECGEIGDKVEKDYIDQLNNCKDFAPVHMIYHFNASKNVKYTKIGSERISRMLKVANSLGITICSENLYLDDMQTSILEDFRQENMKMCYDCGHENFLTPKANILERFGDDIVETHLHDNHGLTDEHKPIGEGNIDYDKIAQKLSKLSETLPLCLEIKRIDDRLSLDFLKAQKASLDELEKKINSYRKAEVSR